MVTLESLKHWGDSTKKVVRITCPGYPKGALTKIMAPSMLFFDSLFSVGLIKSAGSEIDANQTDQQNKSHCSLQVRKMAERSNG